MCSRARPAFSMRAFHVGIKFAAGGNGGRRREYGFRGLGGKLAAGIGGAGLHDHRPALDRTRDIERAAHRKIFALMIEHMQLVGIEKDAVLDVADESVVGPAVPQPGHHVVEFAGAAIALVMLHVVVQAEIQRRIGVGRW